MDTSSSSDIFTYSTDSTRTYDSYVNSLRKENSNKEESKQLHLNTPCPQNLSTQLKNVDTRKNQPKMNNYYNDITGDPPITPEEILGFTKITNKVLSMFQPGLVIQKGLRFSIGAISTKSPKTKLLSATARQNPSKKWHTEDLLPLSNLYLLILTSILLLLQTWTQSRKNPTVA